MNETQAEHQAGQRQERLLVILERLLRIDATEFKPTLNQAAQLVAEALEAEKVDVFLHDPSIDTLIALGTSDTPVGRRQHALGLDRMPIVNGGYMVEVFLTGTSYLTGHLDQDPNRIVGMTSSEGLGIRSEMVAALEVSTQRRGVLMASSRTPDFFSEQDLHFLEAVAGWIGIVIHRTELVEHIKKEAIQQSRRMIAEELLTVLAHDLRTYLTPLKSHIDLIQMRARRGKRTQDIHDTTTLKSALRRLERLIEDLLDVARLDQGLFFLYELPVNLGDLVKEMTSALRTPEVEIEVHIPSQEVVVAADSDRLRQATENLLANAITYAPKDNPVLVRLTVERRLDGSWAVLTVSNQGLEIPSILLEHLFQPFVKGSRSTGLGLGLYLASRITTAHRGTLTVASPTEEGVQFSLSLPIAAEHERGSEQEGVTLE